MTLTSEHSRNSEKKGNPLIYYESSASTPKSRKKKKNQVKKVNLPKSVVQSATRH